MLDRPDDERFETYLKQFRPLVPDALPVNEMRPAPRHDFRFALRLAAGCALAMVILVAAGLRIMNRWRSGESHHVDTLKVPSSSPTPLTLRRANDLLVTAPSYKALMNELTFPPKSSPVPKDRQSALAVLSKEKIKL